MKITIKIRYYHAKDNDDLLIEIKALYGMIRYKKKIPLIKIDDNSPSVVIKEETVPTEASEVKEKTKQFTPKEILNTLWNIKHFLEHVVNLHRIIRFFLSKVKVKDIEWNTIVGLGDAAHTGTITGAIWAAKGAIMGIVSSYMKMVNMPKMNIYPQFQQLTTETLFKCMIQFRVGHAILAGIKIVKYWRGGIPHFKPTNVSSTPFQE